MFKPIYVSDFDLSQPPVVLTGLTGYERAQLLVRYRHVPLCQVMVPVINGRIPPTTVTTALSALIADTTKPDYLGLLNALPWLTEPGTAVQTQRLAVLRPTPPDVWPTVTVAVCTRNRTDQLAACLTALQAVTYPHLELLVVDNAPDDAATARLLQTQFPQVGYVCEPTPGLNRARNRAIATARGEIIAFTDDDVLVDPGWVDALAHLFAADPQVTAVTGLVLPAELEHEAQALFEQYGGFGRGFQRQWFRASPTPGATARAYAGSGRFGTGANMAYRRAIFDQIGYFDPALDVGTPTNGGGDLEMFFRILKEGGTLVYEPAAMVRHRHRPTLAQLHTQITNNGIGFYAHLVRSALAYPEERTMLRKIGTWWFGWWSVRRLLLTLLRPSYFPRRLVWAELWGSLVGLGRYQQARRPVTAAEIATLPAGSVPAAAGRVNSRHNTRTVTGKTAVRTLELSQPLAAIDDAATYDTIHLYATWQGRLLGYVEIDHYGQPISTLELQTILGQRLGAHMLDLSNTSPQATIQSLLWPMLQRQPVAAAPQTEGQPETAVSVVVATFDRPHDLRRCLHSLTQQQTRHSLEIIVVDNHPVSGQTAPTVAKFKQVKLINEPRQGLSYARNAGIAASSGQIIVTTDDDVIAPPHWIEELVAPFSNPAVMVVTGNVLPYALETAAQRMFEQYGGLGRGFERKVVGPDWFRSFRVQAVPTWELGATANAAFRAAIFHHPDIGPIELALGAGSPTGCSEDTYIFYKVLRAGYQIVYEPAAYVWHNHRSDDGTLQKQIYNYSKGHVAYHLLTLFRDKDWRALWRLGVSLPYVHIWRSKEWLLGRRHYPLWLALTELRGHLAGPWALLWSLWRVHKLAQHERSSIDYEPVQAES